MVECDAEITTLAEKKKKKLPHVTVISLLLLRIMAEMSDRELDEK